MYKLEWQVQITILNWIYGAQKISSLVLLLNIHLNISFAIFRLLSQGMAIMQNPKIQVFADAIKFMGRYEADV